jgi:hypothetical protein
MKKTTLLWLQVTLVITSISCLITGQTSQTGSDASDPDQIPSDFELFEEGISYGIRLDSGRESLTNYREAFQIQIAGQYDSGTTIDGFQEYLREIDNSRDASREIETIQMPSQYLSGVREWVQYDGYNYLVRDAQQGGRTCEKNEIPEDSSHISDVHIFQTLQTIKPGELLEENVQVNGVLADVYEIEDLDLLLARELDDISGKVWIAQQPAYFLKAEGIVEGVLEFENTLYTGNATFSYEIKDFGQVQIQLPALCAYPPEEMIPLPPNATEVVDFPEMITFSTPDPVEQVRTFYLDELVSQGWQVVEEPDNEFEQVLQINILTQQGIQIDAEVEIIAMAEGSYVRISWQSYE